MDFSLGEEHRAVAELAAEVLAGHADPARLTRLDAEGWFDREAWQAMASAGLLGIALPEAFGGSGLDLLALHLVIQEAGRTVANVPVVEVLAIGAASIDRLGTPQQRRELLPLIAAGELLVTAALVDEVPGRLTEPSATVAGQAGSLVLDGVKTLVPIAGLADRFLVSALDAEGIARVVIVSAEAEGITITPQPVTADVPHARVEFVEVAVDDHGLLGGPNAKVLDAVIELGRAGLASHQAGLCAGAVRLAADYTSQREQFGRAIATFQAVSQRVADAYIQSQMASLTATQAMWRLSTDRSAAEEVRIAKWWAAQAGHAVLHAVHHVHGGVGVDREYPLHRYFGRAKANEFALGSASDVLVELGARMAAEPS